MAFPQHVRRVEQAAGLSSAHGWHASDEADSESGKNMVRIERQGSADSRIGRHDGCVPPCQRDQRVLARATPRRILQGAGAAIAAALMAVAPPAWAAGPAVVVKHGETVTIDGVRNIVMHADQAKGGILLTGGDGRLNVTDGAQFTDGADNVLIRNRDASRRVATT